MRGVEQIPWLYDAGMVLLEKTGLGRWRSWLAARRPPRPRPRPRLRHRPQPPAVRRAACARSASTPATSRSSRRGAAPPASRSSAPARRRCPSATATFDTVVSGLVFCSVSDVPRGLAEVRRVLKPGGVLRMLEHVRARGRLAARLQDLTQPAWTWFTGGCHPNRDTEARGRGGRASPSTRPPTGPRATCGGSSPSRAAVPTRRARDLESPLPESPPVKAHS